MLNASPTPLLARDAPVTALKSVTPRVGDHLMRLGVEKIRDLLSLFPRRYNPVRWIGELQPNEEQTVLATLWEARRVSLGRSMQGTEAVVGDETGNIRVVWFNQPYLARRMKAQTVYLFSGRVGIFNGRRVLESPHWEQLLAQKGAESLQPGHLFPVYPLTEGLTQRAVRRAVQEALSRALSAETDPLPQELISRHHLLPLGEAVSQAHYPESPERLSGARRRLAFQELLLLQVAVLTRRRALESGGATPLRPDPGVMDRFIAGLPFSLTGAQRRALDKILADLAGSDRPMSRLLQGEVGSGKTVVALAALLAAATCGYQGVLMAPTEVLAEQHYITVARLLQGLVRPLQQESLLSVYLDPHPHPVSLGLLLGSMTEASKEEVRRRLAAGTLDIAIGTHALIQSETEIPRLALAVVDEQHRFGVLQRASLRQRGESSHLLVMSATPIPRTLALTVYGDLDITTLDELPPGRQPIRTRWVRPERRDSVYAFIRLEVQKGRQAFIIYPLIDESEAVNARAAVKEKARLEREVFPDLSVGLLHGRMPLREKEQVMEAFRQREIDILVSTPVVEVGIDVPNATVMVVEGADHFGLAQLHQFRGRIGRGEHPGWCVLVADSPTPEAEQRLTAVQDTTDGFKLAEVDLELRGPGALAGTRQSGLPDLRMASLSDLELLTLARQEAQALLEQDPELEAPEHTALAQAVAPFLGPGAGQVS